MSRILMFVQKYKSKIKDIWKRNQKRLPTYIFLFIAGLYLYGFLVHSIVTGIDNVWQKREKRLVYLESCRECRINFYRARHWNDGLSDSDVLSVQ